MISRTRFIRLQVPLVSVVSCSGVEDPGVDPTEPGTTGSPTSFTPTDSGEELATSSGTTSASTGVDTTTDTDTTTAAAACGNGVRDPGEGCDDGPDNDPYAACTDACQQNVCGDGKVHVQVEECDEGAANVDTGYCRSDCTLNVCGDGSVFAGVEECDSGVENGPEYGGCDENCTVNRCGDGELDAEHEECDDGVLNGSGELGEEGMAGCGELCGFAGRRLFLSSKLFNGDMGSRAGADLACQSMAKEAGFADHGVFRAILADSQSSPNTFLQGASELPFIAPSGLVLALSYAELIALGPGQGITTTETGEVLSNRQVWTNVDPFGDAYLFDDPDHMCEDWTSADATKSARVGRNAVGPEEFSAWKAEHQWLSHDTKSCKLTFRIYCVEVL